MRLSELEPKFIKVVDDKHRDYTDFIDEADGVIFMCPVCFKNNSGPVGTHLICCWRPKVPQNITPGPGRWEMTGNGLDDLTLTAASSSIHLTNPDGCGAHFFIVKGEIVLT